jgi:hypothetical protein
MLRRSHSRELGILPELSSLIHLLSQYPILESLASFVSTLDLLNLALTCRTNHQTILPSGKIIPALQRSCLCDGHGLAERQAFTGLYRLSNFYIWGPTERRVWADEPVEVQLWALDCDEAGALPCRKCGINVCEECRYYSRERPDRPNRRPHLNAAWQNENIMCLCEDCDVAAEEQLRGCFLSELCDCDRYARWICSKCVKEEQKFTNEYYDKHTVFEGDRESTKSMVDHQHNRSVSYLGEDN